MRTRNRIDQVTTIIRVAGLRATKGVISVMLLLKDEQAPLTASQICSRIPGKGINEVTVYRILEKLQEREIVRQIDFQHGHAHYELNDNDHHHLACTSCERVEELSGCSAQTVSKKLAKLSLSFSKITGHSLEFFGICTSCARKTQQ